MEQGSDTSQPAKPTLPLSGPYALSALYASAFSFLRSRTKPQIPIAAPIGKLIDGIARIDAAIAIVRPQPWRFSSPIPAPKPSNAPTQQDMKLTLPPQNVPLSELL